MPPIADDGYDTRQRGLLPLLATNTSAEDLWLEKRGKGAKPVMRHLLRLALGMAFSITSSSLIARRGWGNIVQFLCH